MARRGDRIKGITIEINGDATKLQEALRQVDTQLSSTQNQLRDTQRLLKLDPGNTELIAQRHRQLGDAVSETREKLNTLQTAAEQANDALTRGDISQAQYDGLQREIAATTQELKRLEKQAAQSGEAVQRIAAKGEKLKKLGDTLSDVGGSLTTHVTLPLVAAGGAAVKVAADFDTGMSRVASISGATGDALDALRDKAREMGSKTKFSASEAASAMEYMAMAGWKTEEMLNGIEGIMSLAAASGEDLATTSDIVTDALTAFGLTAADSAHFADVLAAASSNANTNVSMMGETFKYAAPIAGALGFSVEDTAEAIGLMANAGIKSSQAGTSLRSIMNALAGEVKLSGAALGDVTIQTSNADGSMRALGDILADCRAAFSQLTESEQAAAAESLVGKNAMSGFLALMNAAPGDIDKLASAIDNCNGVSNSMADTMQDNLQGQLTILKSQLEELGISFGELIIPLLRDIVSAVQGLVDWLNGLDEGQKKIILTLAAVVAAIGPLLLLIGALLSSIGSIMTWAPVIAGAMSTVGAAITGTLIPAVMGIVTTITGALTGALSALWALILANPITALIALVAGLVAAFLYFWNTSEDFRNAVKQILSDIGNWVGGVAETVKNGFSAVGGFFADLARSAFQWGADFIGGLISGIRSMIGGVISAVSGIAGTITSYLHFSVPDTGPLRDYESWMPDFVAGLARGIEESKPMLRQAAGSLSTELLVRPGSGGAAVLTAGPENRPQTDASLATVVNVLTTYLPQLAHMQVVMDTGTVVGETASRMDRALGLIQQRQRRS